MSPLSPGNILHGYCGGLFGRSDYSHKRVLRVEDDVVTFRYLEGPAAGHNGTYAGGQMELAEYKVPDDHCSEEEGGPCPFEELGW